MHARMPDLLAWLTVPRPPDFARWHMVAPVTPTVLKREERGVEQRC
jgi:hypothetical protein